MDYLDKLIRKLDREMALILLKAIEDIETGELGTYRPLKLSGFKDLYRVRKGRFRIVYRKTPDGNLIESVDCRDKVYKRL